MLQQLKEATNLTTTTDDDITHVSSQSYLLDFFARGDPMRNVLEQEIRKVSSKAFIENPQIKSFILENLITPVFYHRRMRNDKI